MFLAILLAVAGIQVDVARQTELEPGLVFQRFETHAPEHNPGTIIHVLSLDPEHFDLVLLNASENEDVSPRSARIWGEEYDLIAAINASMYQEDHLTSVSLMTTRSHTNNSYVSKDNCLLAFDPLTDDVPSIKLLDRQCDSLPAWRSRYGTLIQSIRMISCEGRNVWSQRDERSSIAAIAQDTRGRVHFIHMTTPQSTHDLINVLQALPLEIDRAMYLEGGTPAQLFVHHPGLELEACGTWCSERASEGERAFALPIPNVIGVVRR
jgi:hypothetical protein